MMNNLNQDPYDKEACDQAIAEGLAGCWEDLDDPWEYQPDLFDTPVPRAPDDGLPF